jgi:hypothetical protein
MAITINGTNGVTFPDSTLQASAAETLITEFASGDAGQPKIVLKAFNGFYSSNAVAGTTTTLFTTEPDIQVISSTTTTYTDWQRASKDYLWYDSNLGATFCSEGVTNNSNIGFIALLGGTYRITYITDNGTSTNNETRILVNGTQVYLVSHTGTTNTTRTFDVTVNPFDQVVIQLRRTSGTSFAIVRQYLISTTGGGLIIGRS